MTMIRKALSIYRNTEIPVNLGYRIIHCMSRCVASNSATAEVLMSVDRQENGRVLFFTGRGVPLFRVFEVSEFYHDLASYVDT